MARRNAGQRRSPGAWGTVELLPSGRWRAFYRRDARKFSAPQTFGTKAEGMAWLASEHADRTRGVWRDRDNGRVPLADYAQGWIDGRPEIAPRTRDLYQRTLDRWIAPRIADASDSRGIELGAIDVGNITPSVVRSWYATVFASARRESTKRRARQGSRATHPAREWARREGRAVAPTGRLSPALIDEWKAAGCPDPALAPAPGVPVDGAGQSAAAHAYRLLRAILSTAVTDGILLSNPCQIKGAGIVHHRARGIATPVEVERLSSLMPEPLRAAVTLAAWSSLRYGELFALARRHVDVSTGTIRVERALEVLPGARITFGRTKTHSSNRTVHLPEFVSVRLRHHLAEHVPDDPDALVFSLSNGQPVSNARLSVLFRRARSSIGREDLTWHDLRHTGAALAYRAGASLPEVQARLGHTTMRAAQIYAHAADDSDLALAGRLDALFGDGYQNTTEARHP